MIMSISMLAPELTDRIVILSQTQMGDTDLFEIEYFLNSRQRISQSFPTSSPCACENVISLQSYGDGFQLDLSWMSETQVC